MPKFTILQSANIADDSEWHLHAAGCRDIGHRKYAMSETMWTYEANDANDAVDDWVDAELIEMGWKASDVKVFACTR